MKSYIFASIAIAFLGLGCGVKNQDKEGSLNGLIIEKSTVRIPLDFKTSFEFYNVRYLKDGESELLIQVNKFINGFNVYDLKSQKLIDQVSFPSDNGPSSVKEIKGICIGNDEEIFVFEVGNLLEIKVFNISGKFLRKLKIIEAPNDLNSDRYYHVNHLSNSSQPTLLYNNELYFSKWPIFDFYDGNNINEQFNFEFSIHSESGRTRQIPVGFPSWAWYKAWNMHFMLHSKTMNDKGEIVYSVYSDDTLRVIDQKLIERKYYLPYSNDEQRLVPVNRRPTQEEELREGLSTYLYTGIHYDKYRNLYYRIVEKPIKYNSKTHKDFQAFYLKPLSLIVLDGNFNPLGEVDLSPDTYISYGIFVGEDGLYIPRLSPNYSKFSEDHVDYSIYKIQTKK